MATITSGARFAITGHFWRVCSKHTRRFRLVRVTTKRASVRMITCSCLTVSSCTSSRVARLRTNYRTRSTISSQPSFDRYSIPSRRPSFSPSVSHSIERLAQLKDRYVRAKVRGWSCVSSTLGECTWMNSSLPSSSWLGSSTVIACH